MKNKNEWDAGSILLIVLAFVFFWPAGIILLLSKLGVFRALKEQKPRTDTAREARCGKYKIMTEGRTAESVEYLASAVGVPYGTALSELQHMIAAGEFGPDAYINFVDRTIVLKKNTAASAQRAERRSAGRGTGAEEPSSGGDRGKSRLSKPFGALPGLLLAAGVMLLFIALCFVSGGLDSIQALGFARSWNQLLQGAFFAAGGAAAFAMRGSMKRRGGRFKTYAAAAADKPWISLAELADSVGVPEKTVRRDLGSMIEKGLLGQEAYIDVGAGRLVIDPAAARPAEPETVPADGEDRYRAILAEIKKLNDDIPDPDVSERIDRIQDLTAKIFRAVSEKPEKLPQIKSFMSYYLPTTLKLLRSYAEFEKNGAEGENVARAKAGISGILDRLADGFERQLDKLYASDAIDISSDIDVLETMMKRDGLAESGFGMASGSAAAEEKKDI